MRIDDKTTIPLWFVGVLLSTLFVIPWWASAMDTRISSLEEEQSLMRKGTHEFREQVRDNFKKQDRHLADVEIAVTAIATKLEVKLPKKKSVEE